MPSLWLIIPAWGRYEVTQIAFPQLADCCDTLTAVHGIDAHAVVIGNDENLAYARQHGFDTIEQTNQPLARKWNDGYQHAAEHGADFFVPCGTDDWLDPAYLAQLPEGRQIRATRWATSIREDGRKLLQFFVDYEGGDGIRIIPRVLLEGCRFRPADDYRERAIDTSVWRTMKRTAPGFSFVYSTAPLNVVQFQSVEPQLNAYQALKTRFRHEELDAPFDVLRSRYPAEFVSAAEEMYRAR